MIAEGKFGIVQYVAVPGNHYLEVKYEDGGVDKHDDLRGTAAGGALERDGRGLPAVSAAASGWVCVVRGVLTTPVTRRGVGCNASADGC